MRRLHHLLERNRADPARILVVEDDRPQAAFARTVLESAGYQVRICDEPQHFEADLRGFRPDLVLMDLRMPGGSGLEAIARLTSEVPDVHVLVLTT